MRGSLAHSIRVGELLRVEASAWLHSTSEAVSESLQSVPPFTARDGALKSGGFSNRTLLNERKPNNTQSRLKNIFFFSFFFYKRL